MFTIAMRTVFVGEPPVEITTILTRLGNIGFGSYAVDTLREGRDFVESGGVELVMSLEKLIDGSGYELVSSVIKNGGSLFIGVETSVGYLWLPVVDHGERVLGLSAIDYRSLEMELADVLTHRSERAKISPRWVPPAPPRVLELRPSRISTLQVVAKEERKQQQIRTMPVPTKATNSLRVSATRSIEIPTSAAPVPEVQIEK